jgi:ankyrin repeat protein
MGPLHAAAYDADPDEVRRLLADGFAADLRDEKGYTPLLCACLRAAVADQTSVIRALIEAGADPNAVTDAGDSNCLMLAVQSGADAAVEALLLAGARIDAQVDGVTALMVAARSGQEQIASLLLKHGADSTIRCGRFAASDYARHGGHDHLADFLAVAARQFGHRNDG